MVGAIPYQAEFPQGLRFRVYSMGLEGPLMINNASRALNEAETLKAKTFQSQSFLNA